MRNLSIIFAMLFFGITLFAQEETVSYIMNDGSVKTYNLSDIEDISMQEGQTAYEMKIHLKDSAPVSYLSNQFDSVQYSRDSYNNYVYVVFSGVDQFSYLLANIDSISYYYDISIILTNDMVLIPAGTFQMGNTGACSNDPLMPDQIPIHNVTISKAFYMSKYEVTQSQYQAVMGNNPSDFKGDNLSVENVTWYGAVAFCNALSQQEGKTPCYTINGTNVSCNWDANGYRLPTEAEWEYACKAGTTTDFYSGNMIHTEQDYLTVNICWYAGNSNNQMHPVGQKQPNAFGLYDMSGNANEWCWDWNKDYSNVPVTDPKGPLGGTLRVQRGGSYFCPWNWCTSSWRGANRPDFRKVGGVGFRIVRGG